MLVVYIMNRVTKILTSCMRELFRVRETNMHIHFDKKSNMKKTMEAFIHSLDTEFIIYHMKEPLVAEKIVFEEDFESKLLEFVQEGMQRYQEELSYVKDCFRRKIEEFKSIFPIQNDHNELDEDMYRKMIHFLYYLMFESQWKAEANEEETEL